MKDTHERGYLSRPIPRMKPNQFFENSAFTPILYNPIVRSSLPLKAVEKEFAADSSSFSVSRFVKWHDEKYGVERSGRDWVKAHIMTGVKTNIVTAVWIGDRDAGDCPQFKPLLQTTAEAFSIGEVSADKAYLSADNVEAVHSHGGTPFIAPKTNTTGAASPLFARMFHFYCFNKDEFLRHYHRRSNVESTFSMMKAKFCDNVRSRTDAAMRNEVLCKVLCHNLCCVIQSQCELGIETRFWPEEAKDDPAILRMPARG